ncbi:phosphoglycerate mutase-like protein [Gymnopus androsaceus JB14]|uniref:Phytase A n=1 Tax=Gymnopus androsaceus JB14 TaxID=1447944 RepID=A0A6A4GXL0_9AGAR|nr:phosphoglycerate mutase-like protein [Gymnopus androsaceus JB14]
MLSTLFLVVSFALLVVSAPLNPPNNAVHSSRRVTSAGRNVAHFQTLWAQYAPYTPAGTYSEPSGCEINQVQRHGSRYPTKNQNEAIHEAVKKIRAAKDITDPNLKTVSQEKYDFTDKDVEQLTAIGLEESEASGKLQYSRYQKWKLFAKSAPTVHSSSVTRVQNSANAWIKGFKEERKMKISPPTVIQKQSDKPAMQWVADNHLKRWKATYLPPITKYLHGVTGAALEDKDTYSLMSMCAFHSSAIRKSTSDQTLSPFCGIFTDEEFKDFAYQGALDKYYIARAPFHERYGLSPEGYSEALHTRLTDPKSGTFYADFSHDNEMSGIMKVLGLFPQARDLSSEKRDDSTNFIVSKITPFAARMAVERMTCGSHEQFVRVLVSDVVQPLAWCGGKEGLCKLEAFVEGPEKKK